MFDIIEIKGIGPVLAKDCAANGYGSVEKIATAKVEEFVTVPGISEIRADHIIKAAKSLLNGGLQQPTAGSAGTNMETVKILTEKNKK